MLLNTDVPLESVLDTAQSVSAAHRHAGSSMIGSSSSTATSSIPEHSGHDWQQASHRSSILMHVRDGIAEAEAAPHDQRYDLRACGGLALVKSTTSHPPATRNRR